MVGGVWSERVDAAARAVRDVGFPALVAAFVLWRLEPQLSALVSESRATNVLLARLADRACVMRGAVLPGGEVLVACRAARPLVVRSAVGAAAPVHGE